MNQESRINLSVVATIYNDEKIVQLLVEEILTMVTAMQITFEIILVNDGSIDNSEEAIKDICEKNKWVKGISLARNYGQQIAMSTGIRNASGDYIVIMDGDLQNPPSLIPKLHSKIQEGFEIIYCVSKSRNNFFNEMSSRFFWFFLISIFKVNIIKNQIMMKIMTRKFVENYNQYNETNRTVTGIVNDIGMKYHVIEVQNTKRHSGKSHYTFFGRFNLMVDMIISLSSAPLNFMIHFGWIIFLGTIIMTAYYLIKYLFYDIAPGFTSIILVLFFFGGIIVLMLGFIGRYLSNIYTEVRQRPLYIIKKKYNFTTINKV